MSSPEPTDLQSSASRSVWSGVDQLRSDPSIAFPSVLDDVLRIAALDVLRLQHNISRLKLAWMQSDVATVEAICQPFDDSALKGLHLNYQEIARLLQAQGTDERSRRAGLRLREKIIEALTEHAEAGMLLVLGYADMAARRAE